METKTAPRAKKRCRSVIDYGVIVICAAISALIFEIFVFPNDFAPAGLLGIATIVQYVFDFQVEAMSLIVNLPMLAVAIFLLGRPYAFRTLTHTLVFAASLFLLEKVDLSGLIFDAQDTGEAILAAIAGGLLSGALYAIEVKAGGSTGGTDIAAGFINRKYPEYDTVWIIFTINVVVAVLSFFVYDAGYVSVILCVIYVFVSGKIGDWILKGARMAAKFEVITPRPEELSRELMEKLNHGCTVLSAKGMYTGEEKFLLICVVNQRQVVEFERIVQKYESTFSYVSTVNGTVGTFHRVK